MVGRDNREWTCLNGTRYGNNECCEQPECGLEVLARHKPLRAEYEVTTYIWESD